MFLFLAGAAPALADIYLLVGQVHPRFHLEICINGAQVNSVQPKPSIAKIFIKQLPAGLVSRGRDTLSVSYRVLTEAAVGTAPVPRALPGQIESI